MWLRQNAHYAHGRALLAGHRRGLWGMDMLDGFGFVIALIAEDFTETGWSRDPNNREKVYDLFGIRVQTRDLNSDAPPPAALAEQQLAELRAAMSRKAPPIPSDD